MKIVSNYYHDKVPIWNGGVRWRVGVGVGMGGHFEHCSIDDFTSTVGWWDEQNMVSYGDDDILFSVFHFQASQFALDKSSLLLFSQPCNGM